MPGESPLLARIEELHGVEASEELDERRHETGPSRLVTGPDRSPRISMEILGENQMIAPVRVALKFSHSTINGAAPFGVPEENTDETSGDFTSHLIEIHLGTGSSRAFHFHRVSVVEV
jgi:hypothetical protein